MVSFVDKTHTNMDVKLEAVLDVFICIARSIMDMVLVWYDVLAHPRKVSQDNVVSYTNYRFEKAMAYMEEGRAMMPRAGEEPVVRERSLYREYYAIIKLKQYILGKKVIIGV